MLSFVAAWRVSLRRARADWPIVIAASLTMLLATTLLAAGPIYSAGVSVAGLRQLLSEASVEAANVRVSAGVPPERLDTVDQQIAAELQRAAGTLPAEVARLGTGDAFELPDQPSDVLDLAQSGFAEGLERHATLVAGAWPVANQEPVGVAVSDAVAEQLGLGAGDRLDLVSRRDTALVLPVTIAAVFRIDDTADPFWWSDARAIDGVTQSNQFRTYGPFLMSRDDLTSRATSGGVSMSWRLIPNYAGMTSEDVAGLQARLDNLPERLRLVAGRDSPRIDTDLPQTLGAASRALVVSRTGMLLLMGQLALLGGYSILLTAGLLIDHRSVETALLRSRGAGPRQVAGLAVVEALVLAVPAVLLGPWCAIVALSLFDRLGPLAQVGLSVPLRVTTDAYLAAGIAGVACVLLLAVPALFSSREFSAERRSLSRAETRPLAQRLGIDLALLAVAAIALWQLRLYGAPLTRTVQGALGPDPLLVGAPALGLLAGAVVAVRLLPRLAEGAEQLLARGRGLVGALGSFQLARRPLRYTRSALMLMLAMSIGVFAVSYASTWTHSQRSQADHQVGADVRVTPSRSSRALPYSSLATAYAAVPGVEQATPIERHAIQLRRAVRGNVLALDASAIPGIVHFRADQATRPLAELLAPLASARPSMTLPTILAGSYGVIVRPEFSITGVEDQQAIASAPIAASIAVRDPHGLVHRFTAAPMTLAEALLGVTIDFGYAADALELASIDVSVALPSDVAIAADSSISVAAVSAVSPESPVPQKVDLGPPDSWRITTPDPTDGVVAISMLAVAVADVTTDEVPALVNRHTLEQMALNEGEALDITLAGDELRLRIVGVVETFPTADAAMPLIIVDLPTITTLRLQAARDSGLTAMDVTETRQPDEWWLNLGAADADEVSRQLAAPPILSPEVVTAAGRLRTLVSDPVAVGIIGALGLGATAAALFALIGLAVAASVSARQRQSEFALLRALGLSRRQLTAWLWLENGSLALVSLVAGTFLGAVISFVVLPNVTVTGDGLPSTPAVVVALPLETIAVLAVAAAVALVVVLLAMAAVLRRMGIGNILRLGEE
jgi:ABC-type lipoprotein release transport system permease subunit